MPKAKTKSETANIYAVVGSDEAEVKHAAAKLAQKLVPDDAGDFGLEVIDGVADNADQAEIASIIGRPVCATGRPPCSLPASSEPTTAYIFCGFRFGAISFGLVNVPVKLYSAVSRKSVRFHQLHDKDGVAHPAEAGLPGGWRGGGLREHRQGLRDRPDRYVLIEPEELEALDPKKTRSIDIQEFVDLDEIDPIYYDHPYYLAPGTGASKAYRLLVQAMQKTNKVAIARVVIRPKENLVAIRADRRRDDDGDDGLPRRGGPARHDRGAARRRRRRPPSARSRWRSS